MYKLRARYNLRIGKRAGLLALLGMRSRDGRESVITLAVALFISTPYAIDGDTIVIERERVRLVQINTPELGTCYAAKARRFTQQFMEGEGEFKLERDPVLDNRDGYGRQLRYLIKGGRNLNLELVRGGYAKPMFYNKVRGKYADLIERYARNAEAKRLGVWNCKGKVEQ